jgi:UDP-glucose 4-epimerase
VTNTVVVVGSNGFVGRAMVKKLLVEGNRVIGIQHEGPSDTRQQYQDENLEILAPGEAPWVAGKDRHSISAVINVAQHSGYLDFPDQSVEVLKTNVLLPVEIAAWCSRASVPRFVHFSSGGIYVRRNERHIKEMDEFDTPTSLGFYLTTKLLSEHALANFLGYSPSIAIVRPFFIYGPSATSTRLIPRLVEKIRSNSPIQLKSENGLQVNPCHVSDVCDLVFAILRDGFQGAVNAAGSHTTSLKNLCFEIGNSIGKEPIFEHHDSTDSDCLGDITLMQELLGRRPIGIFDVGILEELLQS